MADERKKKEEEKEEKKEEENSKIMAGERKRKEEKEKEEKEKEKYIRLSRRVISELQNYKEGTSPDSGVTLKLKGDGSDLTQLEGTIAGPVGSPYEGGVFHVDIQLPSDYPFSPPKLKFITKVWHPNISSQNGDLFPGILKYEWTIEPLETVLLSLQALLSAPQPDIPYDAVVAQQYLENHPSFVSTARKWTESFALGASIGIEEKIDPLSEIFFDSCTLKKEGWFISATNNDTTGVQRLVEMGISEAVVRSTLEMVNYDEIMALEELCLN